MEFGDINEAFYNSFESVLNEMAQLFLSEGAEHCPRFRERVRRLTHADQIGWGYDDALWDHVCGLEIKLAGE